MPSDSSQLFRKTLIITLAASLGVALVLATYFSRWVLLAAVIGIGVGAIASPVLEVMKRKLRIPQGLGAVLFILLLISGIALVSYVLVGLISSELIPLIGEFPRLLAEARTILLESLGRYAWFRKSIESIEIGPAAQSAAQALYQGLQLGTVAVAGLFFSLFVALYFASNPGAYERGFLSIFPAHRREATRAMLRMSARTLRQWFYAQLIAMTVVGFMTGVGLWIIGVPYAAGFGLLTAVLDIIPYIGPMIAFLAVAVITLASDPGNLIWVGIIFVVMQNFEGDVVIPLVMKAGVQLPPIQLMVLMLIMGQWFGILGILVAPPFLAIARSIYLMTYVRKMDEAKASVTPPTALSPNEEKKAG